MKKMARTYRSLLPRRSSSISMAKTAHTMMGMDMTRECIINKGKVRQIPRRNHPNPRICRYEREKIADMIAVVVDMRELFVAERAEVVSFSLILQLRYLIKILV